VKIVFYLVALSLIIIQAVGCEDHRISDDRGVTIYGTISDSATGLPLAAWVCFDSVLDTSLGLFEFADSTGYYRIPNLSSSGNIYSGMEGYQTQMKEYEAPWGGSTEVDFRLVSR
jgi:hypothetical protein